MTRKPDEGPEDSIGNNHGAETQFRYRYQASCTAIFALSLLPPNSEYDAVICELHDDLLMRKKNGEYVIVQVKTRKPELGPFRANENEVIGILAHFVEIDKQYPHRISRFVIATNCGFLEGSHDSRDLPYILQLAQEKKYDETQPNNLRSFSDKLLPVAGSSGNLQALLARVRLDRMGDLGAIKSEVVDQLLKSGEVQADASQRKLAAIADALVAAAEKASSTTFSSTRSVLDVLEESPENKREKDLIRERTLTGYDVRQIIGKPIDVHGLLRTRKPLLTLETPLAEEVVKEKLQKGVVAEYDIEYLLDCKWSAEGLMIEWSQRHGRLIRDQVREHLAMKVRGEWCEVFDEVKAKSEEPFGQEVLDKLRTRLHDVYDELPEYVKSECQREHLLGVAAMLTEDCTVRWSSNGKVGGTAK